jgi:putative hemolysin
VERRYAVVESAGTIAWESNLFEELQRPLREKMPLFLKIIMDRVINTEEIHNLCQQLQPQTTPGHFCDRLLRYLGISYRVSDNDLARIPEIGPLLVVANHPFGAVEGLVLASLLRSVRPDVKILANSILRPISELESQFIWVDPFGGTEAPHRNFQPLRDAVRWLERGGLLAAFPAGEVAHYQYDRKAITDPAWKDTITRIARRLGVPVLTLFFSGMNSRAFQLFGMLHPKIRTALLFQEMLKKRNQTLDVLIGKPISPARLRNFESPAVATEFLRMKTYLLGQRSGTSASIKDGDAQATIPNPIAPQPIAPPEDVELLESEIRSLGEDPILCRLGNLWVLHAGSAQIPKVLREIGRQREIAFRAVGEATGREIDLDCYDHRYQHIFLWDQQNRRILGAYRVGHTDRILSESGIKGLYVNSLFPLSRSFLKRLGPALELGRAFVRQENQCDGRSLPLLWSGIARYIAKQPEYRYLYGPVSISSNYRPVSRQMMAWFLRDNHASQERLRMYSRLKSPSFMVPDRRAARKCCESVQSLEDLSDLISDIEPDSKGIPVLLRHYVRLGAKVLAFNIDPQFGNCLDALVVVDLAGVNARLLERLMGKPASTNFLRFHNREAPDMDAGVA